MCEVPRHVTLYIGHVMQETTCHKLDTWYLIVGPQILENRTSTFSALHSFEIMLHFGTHLQMKNHHMHMQTTMCTLQYNIILKINS